jgi:hypothetical protein
MVDAKDNQEIIEAEDDVQETIECVTKVREIMKEQDMHCQQVQTKDESFPRQSNPLTLCFQIKLMMRSKRNTSHYHPCCFQQTNNGIGSKYQLLQDANQRRKICYTLTSQNLMSSFLQLGL